MPEDTEMVIGFIWNDDVNTRTVREVGSQVVKYIPLEGFVYTIFRAWFLRGATMVAYDARNEHFRKMLAQFRQGPYQHFLDFEDGHLHRTIICLAKFFMDGAGNDVAGKTHDNTWIMRIDHVVESQIQRSFDKQTNAPFGDGPIELVQTTGLRSVDLFAVVPIRPDGDRNFCFSGMLFL